MAIGLVLAMLVELPGCATLNAPSMETCRSSDGRFAVCPTGGSSEGALIGLGVAAGIGLIAGLVYLVTRSNSNPPNNPPGSEPYTHQCRDAQGHISTISTDFACPETPATVASSDCVLPVEAVLVCRSSQGYQFAIPAPGTCAPGSQPDRTIRLTCADLNHPAYHACLTTDGGWQAVRSWETCASRGYTDALGDFVPPGRTAAQGVAPDGPQVAPRILRCMNSDGYTVPSEATSCAAAGLADATGVAPSTSERARRGSLRCFTQSGEPAVTTEASCAAAGYSDAAPVPPTVPEPPSLPATRTCVGRRGRMLDLSPDQPCPRGYIDRDAPEPRHGRHHGGFSTGSVRGPVRVRGYRANGTYVAPYTRSAPRSRRRR